MDRVEEMRKWIDGLKRTKSPNLRERYFYSASFDSYLVEYFHKNGFDKEITEGINKTYSAETTVRYLKKCFNFSSDEIEYDSDTIRICIRDTQDNWDILRKAMDLCGWHYATEDSEDVPSGYVTFQFERRQSLGRVRRSNGELTSAKAQDMVNVGYGVAYHITPKSVFPKIKKNGLCPKSKNSFLSYPDRIYFSISKHNPSEEECFELAQMLYRVRRDSFRPGDSYIVFLIDLSKCPELEVFPDPNYSKGLYTTQNIPSVAIGEILYDFPEKLLKQDIEFMDLGPSRVKKRETSWEKKDREWKERNKKRN